MKRLFLAGCILLSANTVNAAQIFKCTAMGTGVSATGYTKNSAIFNTTNACVSKAPVKMLCSFSLISCEQSQDIVHFACQMATGQHLITLTGATEEDTRAKVIEECKKSLSFPTLCEKGLPVKCLNLAE